MESDERIDARPKSGSPYGDLMNCGNCIAWKLKPNQVAPIFGGCARSGTTTLHYGTTAYNHYTTDLQSCSAWEPK